MTPATVGDAQFADIVRAVLRIDLHSNPGQDNAIMAPVSECLFIVAGPGSGKTTVLALRALKLIFADGLEPNQILATTFTRRAAKELRSRILGWGDQLRQGCLASGSLTPVVRTRVSQLNFNAVTTGTLDSIAEMLLGQTRAPGTQPPAVIEDFSARSLMLQQGLFPQQRYNNRDLRNYLVCLRGTAWGLSPTEMASVLGQIHQRFVHDFVNLNTFRTNHLDCGVCPQHPHLGIAVACDAINDYETYLAGQGVVDYGGIEHSFFMRLQTGGLTLLTTVFRALLVDEYQDTNLLQEAIYFSLAHAVIANQGGLAVVGDDDQSLYRFRGATVRLFQAHPSRLRARVSQSTNTIFLADNYRSTEPIVRFCNDYIHLDHGLQSERVQGKPCIVFKRMTSTNLPVLGLFRDHLVELARDTAAFVHSIFHGAGYTIPSHGTVRASQEGSVGDCALLVHSPLEVKETFNLRTRTVQRRERFPLLLRRALAGLDPRIEVFNPRGQHLSSVPEVELLCGLVLECIDPDRTVQQSSTGVPGEALTAFDRWRVSARACISQNPPPRSSRSSLPGFIRVWQRQSGQWPDEVGLAELVYKLVTWIPAMQSDVESLVRLELIQRAITESGRFSPYQGYIAFRDPQRKERSVRAALRHILAPIALGALDVDEDLLETLPRDRLNVLSIHQSKGLEFPLVLVDVGSDFGRNSASQAFLRYPDQGNTTHRIEDDTGAFSPTGRSARSGIDRAFDDLIRLYFVAFSRAQDVLVLVGLNTARNSIRNVAAGWDRQGNWRWGQGLPNLTHI